MAHIDFERTLLPEEKIDIRWASALYEGALPFNRDVPGIEAKYNEILIGADSILNKRSHYKGLHTASFLDRNTHAELPINTDVDWYYCPDIIATLSANFSPLSFAVFSFATGQVSGPVPAREVSARIMQPTLNIYSQVNFGRDGSIGTIDLKGATDHISLTDLASYWVAVVAGLHYLTAPGQNTHKVDLGHIVPTESLILVGAHSFNSLVRQAVLENVI